jgi:hypothetical protein
MHERDAMRALLALIGLIFAATPGCRGPLTPGERAAILSQNSLTEADVAECSYEAQAATAGMRGIIMPAATANHLGDMCLRSHSLRNREAGAKQR